MLFMIASWFFWFFVISGIGKWFGEKVFSDAQMLNGFEFFWLGLTALTALAGVLQLFCPLNNVVLWICLITGLAGHVQNRNHAPVKAGPVYFITALAVLAIVSLPYLMQEEFLEFGYDTNLYHFSVVRWINEYATVPGLANLHTRLGYGTASSFFTFAALFDNCIWDGRSALLANPFLLAVTMLQILSEVFYGTGKTKIYSLVCLPYLFLNILLSMPNLYFDAAVFCFLIIAGLYVIKMIEKEAPFELLPEKTPFSFYVVPSLVTFAFTVKPMAAVVFVCCALVYGAVFVKRLSAAKIRLRPVLTAAVIPLLLLLGYMSRNFVTSGWLLFPSPHGEVSTAWSLSREAVENEYSVIKLWARAPGPDFMTLGDKSVLEWALAWLSRNMNVFQIGSFFLPLILASAVVLRYLTRGKKRIAYVITFAALYVSLVFWFLSAPDTRFACGITWLLLAFSLTALYDSGAFSYIFNFIQRRAAALFILAVTAEAVLLTSVVLPMRHFDFSLWHTAKSVSFPVKQIVLNNGQTPPLTVWVPENSAEDRCGDAPLPCTPYPNDRLCLFVPGDLSKGFYLKPAD